VLKINQDSNVLGDIRIMEQLPYYIPPSCPNPNYRYLGDFIIDDGNIMAVGGAFDIVIVMK
jgi:hypothetical protein